MRLKKAIAPAAKDKRKATMDAVSNSGKPDHVVELTADIVAAYVSNHVIPSAQLPALITHIHSALRETAAGTMTTAHPVAVEIKPAVPIKKSVSDECIVCLEDGRKFKSLKRHLKASHDLTPEQYKARWNLPSDYPLVAAAYSSQRSKLARQSGLGRARARSKG